MENNQGKTALGLDQNTGALLCYIGNLICSLGFIYSVIVIVTDKGNKFTRFHAFQSVLFSVFGGVLGGIAGAVAALAMIIDANIGVPLFSIVIGLVLLIIGVILLVSYIRAALSAFRGEKRKMMIIGNMAEKWSEKA